MAHYPATSSVGASSSDEFRPSRPGERSGGRQRGTPNRTTQALRAAILAAADEAHPEGTVGYLKWLATNNSAAFASLLGKVLPKEIEAGVSVRHTLEDFVLVAQERRKAMAGLVDTSQAHAAQSAPPIEQRAEFSPTPAVIDGRPAVSLEIKTEGPVGLIPAQPGLSLQALVLSSMRRPDQHRSGQIATAEEAKIQ